MAGIEHINHSGVRILAVDYSGLSGQSLRDRVAEASETIRREPEGALLLLLRVRGVSLTPETTDFLIEQLKANSPHVEATAFVGLDHLERIVPVAMRLTGRHMETFDHETAALDWLASHAPPAFEPDPHVKWIEHGEERILRIDFSACGTAELERRIKVAALAIRSSPPRSVLALNLVHAFVFDRANANAMMEYVSGNRPYILAAAVVGLDYMKAVVPVLNRMAGRNISAFDDVETAMNWLVSRKKAQTRT